MADMVEYYQQISEIKKAIRERELHRLELEREALTKAHKRERRHEELREKLKGLHKELVREEAQAALRIQGLLARVESVKKEHQQLAIRTERLREKKRQYELHFVTASADLHFSPHQKNPDNSYNTGAAAPLRPGLAFSLSSPVRPATSLYNTVAPTTSSLPATAALWPSREQPNRLQAVEQMWMQQDKSQPLQVPGSETQSQAHLSQVPDYSNPLVMPTGNIDISHPSNTGRQEVFQNQQNSSLYCDSSDYQRVAPHINQACRESGNIPVQPYAQSPASFVRKDSVASHASLKGEEPGVTLASEIVDKELLSKNLGSVLPQRYADANIPQAESTSKEYSNAVVCLDPSHPAKEQGTDDMVSHPQSVGGISVNENPIYDMERGRQPLYEKKMDEVQNQKSLTPEKTEEIRPAAHGEGAFSSTIPRTVSITSADFVPDARLSPEKDAPSVSSKYSNLVMRENSPAMKKYNEDFSPACTDGTDDHPAGREVTTTQNMNKSAEITSRSSGADNEAERQMKNQWEGESVSANEASHTETPVHPAGQVREEAKETVPPRDSHSSLVEDDSDFYDRTSPVTASAAYQKMAKGGTELGTESESEGVEDALAPASFARKIPPRPAFKTFASSIPSLRPGPGGTDTDSVDSVEAAIQAAMKSKNKDEGPTPSGPDVDAGQEGSDVTSGEVKKSGMVEGEAAGTGAENKVGKGKVEESKKGRPAAALRLTLESDEESCVVSAGAEASDEDDFDFYDKF